MLSLFADCPTKININKVYPNEIWGISLSTSSRQTLLSKLIGELSGKPFLWPVLLLSSSPGKNIGYSSSRSFKCETWSDSQVLLVQSHDLVNKHRSFKCLLAWKWSVPVQTCFLFTKDCNAICYMLLSFYQERVQGLGSSRSASHL